MPNIDVAFLKNGKARVYNRELGSIADYIEVDRERAEKIVSDKDANILLLDDQIISWEIFIEALKRNAVIIAEEASTQISVEQFGEIKMNNYSYERITLDNSLTGMLEDDKYYLMDVEYSLNKDVYGKVQLERKTAHSMRFIGITETASIASKRALERALELQADNVIIRYIDGVMTYGHKK